MSDPPESDWYLREWMAQAGKNQTALVSELGLNKSTANFIWHGRQPYRRDLVNKIAAWLGLRPYELLMRPDEAVALRRMREMAHAIAAEPGRKFEHDHDQSPPTGAHPRTGTNG